MKNYIATFQIKGRAFNANDIETMWFNCKNRKDAENRARCYARQNGNRFLSIRLVK